MLLTHPLKVRRAQLTYTLLPDLGQEAHSALKWATLRLLARSPWGYLWHCVDCASSCARVGGGYSLCGGQRFIAGCPHTPTRKKSLQRSLQVLEDAF